MKFFLAVLIAALAAVPALVAGGNIQAGQGVFDKTCKVCHGPTGQGNPAIAKALKVTLPDLGSHDIQIKSDDEIRKTITEGKNKMKPVKTISGNEITDVIAYVRTLAKK